MNGVTIAQQIERRLVSGERLPNLLHRPFLGRLFRHLEMQYVASGVREHDEDKQNPERAVGTVKKSMEAICPT
jgi:hypothetical protein